MLVKECNQTIIGGSKQHVEDWIKAQGSYSANLIAVKDFMVSGLDDSILSQKQLKEQFKLFFECVYQSPSYTV